MRPPILTVVIPTLDEVSTVGRCLNAIGTDADLRRALEGESLGGELRARLQASVGAAGRSAGP